VKLAADTQNKIKIKKKYKIRSRIKPDAFPWQKEILLPGELKDYSGGHQISKPLDQPLILDTDLERKWKEYINVSDDRYRFEKEIKQIHKCSWYV
jgi:hypothetical protein